MKGIVYDFQAQWGSRDFSGHPEPRVLRGQWLAGQLYQPRMRVALTTWLMLEKPELSRDTDKEDTAF